MHSPAVVNDKRETRGWMLYNFANSAFSTTVVSVFLGPYLTSLIALEVGNKGTFSLLGVPIAAGSFFTYCVSISVLSQVFVLPIFGAIADYSNLKKRLMLLFAALGSLCTMGLFFITGASYVLGGVMFIVANIAFGASIVFYNAFLPEIASEDQRDRISSRGWALGNIGGGLLLLLNLILYQCRDWIGLDEGMAVRISLASAGVWWLAFGAVAIRQLHVRGAQRTLPAGESYVGIGFGQLWETLTGMRKYPMTLRYLIAYLLYNDGVQTVMVVAALFGAQELGMKSDSLILVILMVQFVAFLGALFFGLIAARIGAQRAILISLWIWSAISVWAQLSLKSVPEFWLLAALVAVVLGGTQALSRSLFSQMIPRGREAEFFSFYEISDKGTSWMGTLIFGLVTQWTGSMRTAIFSLIILFGAGLLLLRTVDVRRAITEAGNEVPANLEGEPVIA
jgi:UMF1 family MFS transporter